MKTMSSIRVPTKIQLILQTTEVKVLWSSFSIQKHELRTKSYILYLQSEKLKKRRSTKWQVI